jgi:hypothetical protein
MSSRHMLKVVLSSRLCVPFLGSWIVCLTAWITDAQRMVLKASLLIASAGNEMTPITVVVWRPPDYKYLLYSSLRTISHSFPLFALGFSLSCPLLTINGGPKKH